MQRIFDMVLSGLAILVFTPVLIPVVLALRFTGEGEIFYYQKRVGRNGKLFNILKFATMLKDSPNIGTGTVTLSNDFRILPFGKFLRKTKINELPQLLNILTGDMSIIGPRPLTIQTFNSYDLVTQNTVKMVRPGLSGIGSIIFRNEEQILSGNAANLKFYENIVAPYKGNLEIWYVNKRSIIVYILLIFATMWHVLFPRSKLIWTIFNDLPKPPKDLRKVLS